MSCLIFFLAIRFQSGHEHSVADQLFVFADNTEIMVHQTHVFARGGDPVEGVVNSGSESLDAGFFLF